ncbi:MAG: hypothetical protein ACJ761_12115 [Chloroflexota bacterium]
MTPLLPLGAGLAALAVGYLVLRTLGSGYRVGRLLGVTPRVGIDEAIALAGGAPRYVGVSGRIDSEADFEDDAHRPLVFRRSRIEVRRGGRWQTIDDRRDGVPFGVREGAAQIGVDKDGLGTGLVVVPREARGSARDIADRLGPDMAGIAPDAPARLRVEQVSSVEHAVVLGVPTVAADGSPTMAAGLGRPLVLSTLEDDEAMRILAGGRRNRPLIAAISLGLGLVLLTVGLAWALVDALVPAVAVGASATPPPPGGDPRSSGQGPGLVGDPGFAILAVVVIGLLAVIATLAYIRLTPEHPSDRT